MGKYKLTSQAEDDLWRIYRWGYHMHGEAQADAYHYNLLNQFETIAGQPYLFQIAENLDQAYRRCPCGSNVIYYQIKDHSVGIIRILGRQDLSRNL